MSVYVLRRADGSTVDCWMPVVLNLRHALVSVQSSKVADLLHLARTLIHTVNILIRWQKNTPVRLCVASFDLDICV